MEHFFKGKRVLVTGAGKGIGRAVVLRLSGLGAKVVALSRTESDLVSLCQEGQGSEHAIIPICVDLANWTITRKAVEEAGTFDLLVNNAAIALLAPFMDVKPEDVDASFDTNVKSVINVSQVVVAGMIANQQGGAIVNLSSQASQAALADHAVYCASKGALDMLTKVMALELGKYKIRVNCVNPTVVMTAMGRLGWSDPTKAGPLLTRIPLGRFAEVSEVVETILFLLSDKASMITGATLPVDGGFLV